MISAGSPRSAGVVNVGSGWFPDNPGGIERYVYDLARHLADADAVELCGVGIPEGATLPGVKLTNLCDPEQSFIPRLWTARQGFLDRQITQPEAVNLHFALYGFPILRDLPDVPITCTFHGPWALESQLEKSSQLGVRFKGWIEGRVYQRCDRFIVLSQAFGEILHQHYGVSREKIHKIPGGVDTQRFQMNLSRGQAREVLGWPLDRQILFTPRRLVRRMGVDNLLQAIAAVKAKVPDVWLAIAGKGPQRAELEAQVTELGLQDTVKFLGFLPEAQLPMAYQAADLTVIPSQALEGFGLVVLESLASGTPVLCTPVGGMPEIIQGFSPG
ncbi:Mannosylfructose-phosphate synthase [Acaryochloris thomasi RCC1774]|uniref:Mannosylfructose-phosphate synthase n=1 Tax=Acaryochloris thomasi RCC1774 TaxID=1764569 RepID=A0A2W1JJF9_9CYAN|nr:glycosyltransferase family 4 protein [Acaryochloris thomasi]PZD71635.1 Mannosylfructose-phosphate synthase [Acaryochloris thomasi RCC1774]